MNSIKQWISSILIAAFVINVIDILVPTGSFKKYINIVLNFIFIFIVITPVLNTVSKDIYIEDKILKQFNEFQYEYNHELMSKSSIDEEEIMSNYDNYLKQSINMKLEESGYQLTDIETDEDGQKKLIIKDLKTSENSNNDTKEKIQLKENENYKQAFNELKDVEHKKVKEDLNKIFKISIEKIKIN
ncbi:MAG: stage III sporulation protein AF [Tepidibacter sp.]|jgi:stage III sporulation protein AF|uniref:stage III sporulation protein AF n=1 Tax=Tepidibacter sp. TaxID=2529387 RepID=UPI0025E6B27A|nr:stage III sporulation protein AF [Tepidibacter sp.]MCT4508170.1 stage III sporulation protein AF [Tepidibacter sp.]